jgi:5,10-methylenetetrahydromethanopterin reductase
MQVGLGLQSDKHPDEYAALGRVAEDGGFDVVSVYHDLLFQPAIGPLVLIANATERIRLGPAALNPFTLHPVEIAGQVATLDLVSRGRAFLGLASGAWLDRIGLGDERALTGVSEAVEIVRRLFSGDRTGFEGRRFVLAPGAGLGYEPLRTHVPLMIGTWAPRTAAYAGRVADELKLGGCANPDMVRVMRSWIANEDVALVVGAVTVVDEDAGAAWARARNEVSRYLEVVAGRDLTLELRPGQEPPLDRFVLAGTPEDVAAQALALVEAGADRVEFGTPQGLTTAGGIELLARRVLPLLRG